MKKNIIALLVLCGIIAGAVVLWNKSKSTPPAPAPLVESTPEPPAPATPEKMAAPKPEAPPAILASADKTAQIPAAIPGVSEAKPDDAADSIHKAVDALLSAKNAAQKHELFQQLLKSGQMDAAIAELKQRATDNPNDAEIPTTLGEAEINKVAAIHAAGGDANEMGILAMQADQSFNAALKIDPKNWEAQFVKSSAMFYWPPDEKRDNDVVQRLSSLIDQQDTMASQPQFAQTYVVLGNQYQKIGQPDKALATWQLGLSKFPGDPVLQKKTVGQ